MIFLTLHESGFSLLSSSFFQFIIFFFLILISLRVTIYIYFLNNLKDIKDHI